MLTGIDHVTIAVRDLDACTDRLAALLGTAPSWRGEHEALGTRAALFGIWNTVVELVAPHASDERDEGLREMLETRGEGLVALAFAAADVSSARGKLRERGLRVAPVEEGEARSLDDGTTRTYRTVQLSPKQTRGLTVLAVERADGAALRGSDERDPSVVHAMDHVVIRTRDPDAAISLYRDGLGVRLALDRNLGGRRMVFFRTGKLTLEVVEEPDLDDQDRLWGVAYRVRDIDAAHARLVQAGFDVGPVRTGAKPGTTVLTVRDAPGGVPTLVLRDPSRD